MSGTRAKRIRRAIKRQARLDAADILDVVCKADRRTRRRYARDIARGRNPLRAQQPGQAKRPHWLIPAAMLITLGILIASIWLHWI